MLFTKRMDLHREDLDLRKEELRYHLLDLHVRLDASSMPPAIQGEIKAAASNIWNKIADKEPAATGTAAVIE